MLRFELDDEDDDEDDDDFDEDEDSEDDEQDEEDGEEPETWQVSGPPGNTLTPRVSLTSPIQPA